jgi:hypothetical protein
MKIEVATQVAMELEKVRAYLKVEKGVEANDSEVIEASLKIAKRRSDENNELVYELPSFFVVGFDQGQVGMPS